VDRENRKPTIKTIAALAGVSRGTVDRALNRRGDVAAAVADRIQSIADELGYIPNKAAKALRFNHTPRTIGVLLPRTSDGFFHSVADGVTTAEAALADMGIHTTISRFDPQSEAAFEQALEQLLEAGVSGLVLTGPDTTRTQSAVAAAIASVPVVTVNSDIRVPDRLCFVGQDLVRSGRVAAELMGKVTPASGSVIAVTGNLSFQAHRDRVDGFCAGMSVWRSEIEVRVVEGHDTYEGTTAALMQELSRQTPVGLYMATGSIEAALNQLSEHGLAGSVRVITNDLLPAVQKGLRNRTVDYTIQQDPFHQGEQPIRILSDYLLSGTEPTERWYRSPILITGAESLL
jgi:LacI family transcriptional regulator